MNNGELLNMTISAPPNPDKYKDIEIKERLEIIDRSKTLTHDEMMAEFGVTHEDLDEMWPNETWREYDFTLYYREGEKGDEQDHDEWVRRLGEGGVTEALMGSGSPWTVTLNFTKGGWDLIDALQEAHSDVLEAVPQAKLIGVWYSE